MRPVVRGIHDGAECGRYRNWRSCSGLESRRWRRLANPKREGEFRESVGAVEKILRRDDDFSATKGMHAESKCVTRKAGPEMTSMMAEKFSVPELSALRSELLQSGLD